jgi:hypothetical protein
MMICRQRMTGGLGAVVGGFAAALLMVSAGPDPVAAEPATAEVLIEGAAAYRLSDVDANLDDQQLKFDGITGYTIGFRFRWYLSRDLCVAPAFSFTDFKNHEIEDPERGVFSLHTGIIRYFFDLQWVSGRGQRGLRPLLSVGAGLCRNRYGVSVESPSEKRSDSVNALGVDLGAGLRLGDFEILFVYEINRFTTYRFVAVDDRTRYNWDNVQVRLSWAFPTR